MIGDIGKGILNSNLGSNSDPWYIQNCVLTRGSDIHTSCSQLLLVFSLDHSTLCRYITDILKMCMKKFDAEKIFFDKLTGFLDYPFSMTTAPSK